MYRVSQIDVVYTLFGTLFLSNEMRRTYIFLYEPQDTGKVQQHVHRSSCVQTNIAVKLSFDERKWLLKCYCKVENVVKFNDVGGWNLVHHHQG